MKVIGIICAKGESARFPGKNKHVHDGTPLFWHSVRPLLESKLVDDVYVAESWIIDEPNNDKSNVYGYNLDKGTWFGLFKVDNDEYWRDFIKTGKVKGVSVEGYFINKLTKLV